ARKYVRGGNAIMAVNPVAEPAGWQALAHRGDEIVYGSRHPIRRYGRSNYRRRVLICFRPCSNQRSHADRPEGTVLDRDERNTRIGVSAARELESDAHLLDGRVVISGRNAGFCAGAVSR